MMMIMMMMMMMMMSSRMTEPTNFILYIQLTGYCIAAILSLCVTIPMSMHQDNFKVSYNTAKCIALS